MSKSKRTPRAVRTAYWRRPVADPSEALVGLQEATSRRMLASVGQTDEAILEPLRDRERQAQAAVDECFEKVRLHALPGTEFEQLIAEHPPTEEDTEQGLAHHDETFLPALAARCADNGWSEDDWCEEIAELSAGERRELREIVTHLNTRSWSEQIPKG